jgi:hypothetical protein
MKYTNRSAGWMGVAEGSKGMFTSHQSIATYKTMAENEMVNLGWSAGKINRAIIDIDDSFNMMFGRPTSGGELNYVSTLKHGERRVKQGVSPPMRRMQDMAYVTMMGSLGSNQLIETGQASLTAMRNVFSQEPVFRAVMKLMKSDPNEINLLNEVAAVSGIMRDVSVYNRQATHIDDQAEFDIASVTKRASLAMAETITGGKNLASATRMLSEATGFNQIKKAQDMLQQASFVMDVAKHFKYGTGKQSHGRLAEIGLTDENGVDAGLKRVFETIVEWNPDTGLPHA